MDLIIGGAYQGKRAYARSRFDLGEDDIFTCREDAEPDWDARCIAGLESFALRCVREGVDPVELFRANESRWENSVLICEDIFCGVVPLGAENRAWREAAGRLCAYLAVKADSVTRMFCGLAGRLK